MEHSLKNITKCPICGSESFAEKMVCKDHTVSQNTFKIVECAGCRFQFTNPIPTEESIGNYYKSDEYISHSGTNKGIMNKAYHWVRKRTIRKKEKLIQNLVTGRDLLDIGCGTGEFLKYCHDNGWRAVGLEPDDDAREFAVKSNGVDARTIDNLYQLPARSFDVITMWHVLEHVYNLNEDLEQILSLLKEGGRLVVAVPNRSSYDAEHYGEEWAAYDLPRHLYHFSPDDIKRLCEKHGATLESMYPMKWDAYYVSMLSESYKQGNKLKGLAVGMRSNRKAKNGSYSSQIYVVKK